MAINFNSMKAGWDKNVFDNFKKSLTRTPVTKTNDNVSGDETLSDGTPDTTYEGVLYRKEDEWAQDKVGLFQGADAVLLVKTTQSLSKNDKITYDSEIYRVESIKDRELGKTAFYKVARLFLI